MVRDLTVSENVDQYRHVQQRFLGGIEYFDEVTSHNVSWQAIPEIFSFMGIKGTFPDEVKYDLANQHHYNLSNTILELTTKSYN